MQVVGITGTNGKTTTAYLLRAVFESAGKKCGLLGTVAYSIGDESCRASRTTPEAPDVQRMFRQMVDAGCGACVMEVSSHALALRRVDGTVFAAGVFTNLTRDHLDYHGDMESYFAAKKRLFEMLPPGAPRVINLDDPRGESLRKAADTVVTYAMNKPADVTPGPLTLTFGGLEFDARTPKGNVHVKSRLVGRPNVSNVLATVATATALDVPVAAIERGLARLTECPDASNWCRRAEDDVTVVIDYAHTDDALKNLLETARPLAHRRVITVFGCGGDRDRTKRPLMGAVAARLSDIVVMTSDNPRTEDPARIIEEIKRGVPTASDRAAATFTILDRKEAIQFAIGKPSPAIWCCWPAKDTRQTQVIGSRATAIRRSGDRARGAGAETLTPACCRRCDRREGGRSGRRSRDNGVFDRHEDPLGWRSLHRDSRRSLRRQRLRRRGGGEGRGRGDCERPGPDQRDGARRARR